jgi:hypothetical protein
MVYNQSVGCSTRGSALLDLFKPYVIFRTLSIKEPWLIKSPATMVALEVRACCPGQLVVLHWQGQASKHMVARDFAAAS